MEVVITLITLLGGLALFLYGMNMLSGNLEKLSGGKQEYYLEKMTNNVFKGVLVGLVITACIQSSSATTVIVVGLVNAGILKLRNAIGVIMGANIGTTVTAQILRLAGIEDGGNYFLMMFKPEVLAPLAGIIAILMIMGCKKQSHKMVGEFLMGFSILFTGMQIMSDSASLFADSPVFQNIFATLTNPFLGVLVGAGVTAIIQSSSASVGILQALAQTGVISCSAAIPIILGQNIGTCITSLLASIGASTNAKRAAMVHLYFNIIGTVLFLTATYVFVAIAQPVWWTEPITMGGIADFHTLFNVVVTLVLLPFTWLLEKLAVLTIRDKKKLDEDGDDYTQDLAGLEERFLQVSPSIAISQCEQVVLKMGQYAAKNFSKVRLLYRDYDPRRAESIRERETAIDRMEDRLNNYILRLGDSELTEKESRTVTQILKMTVEFERIGDYAMNILERAEEMHKKGISFSNKAQEELEVIFDAVEEILDKTMVCYDGYRSDLAVEVEPLEEIVDQLQERLRYKHIQRLKRGKCTIDCGCIFLAILTDLERISDHCSNVAVYVIGYNQEADILDRHQYIQAVHQSQSGAYAKAMEEYQEKYLSKINMNKYQQ